MGTIRRLLRFWGRHQTLLIVTFLLVTSWVLALASGLWFFFRLAYILSALVPLSYLWAWLSLHRLEVSVQRYAQSVQVGQEAEERIRVRSRIPFPALWLEVEDPSDMPGRATKTVISLNAGGFRSWKLVTPCHRRGLYTVGPLSIESGDPFGLFRRKRSFGGQHTLLVYPLPEALPRFWAPPADLTGEGRQRRPTHHVTPSAATVRDYEPGDSFGRIHWPTTARAGQLMVKTFEQEPASDIWVVLDLHGDVQAGSGDDSTEEYGVRVACSVANHFLSLRRPVGYLACGADMTVLWPSRGDQHFARILEALALAKGVGGLPLADLLNREARRFGRHTTLVVITPSADESWVQSLQRLVEKGVKVAAVLLEAGSFGGPRSALLTFSALAASDIVTYLVRRGDHLAEALSAEAIEPRHVGAVPLWRYRRRDAC